MHYKWSKYVNKKVLCKEVNRLYDKHGPDTKILQDIFFAMNNKNTVAENLLKDSDKFTITVLNKPLKVILIRVRLEKLGFSARFYIP